MKTIMIATIFTLGTLSISPTIANNLSYTKNNPINPNTLAVKTCPPGQKFVEFFNSCEKIEKPVSTKGLDRGMLQFCNLTMGIYGKCPCIVRDSMAAGFTTTQFIHLAGKETEKTTPQQQAKYDKIFKTCLNS